MNLFINAVSLDGAFILFDDTRKIISRENIDVAGNESSKLIDLLNFFLEKNNLKYTDIKNIVVVSGPGGFTGVRTISLLVNTINYVTKNHITDISYFDLFDTYPICKSSSKRDSFVQKNKEEDIEVVANIDLLDFFLKNNIKEVNGELDKDFFKDIKILDFIDYESIISEIEFKDKKQIEPLYIKKPSIS